MIVLLLGWLLVSGAMAGTLYPAIGTESSRLNILSSTDETAMQFLVRDFQQLYPDVTVEYLELSSLPLFERFTHEQRRGTFSSDLVISSAMDLQIRLVNDGMAATHDLAGLDWLPEWAQWRAQAFGLTCEPAVMIYNRRLLPAAQVPRNRFELIELLRNQQERFQGRVGTYDIARSGLGYLFASQDAQQASTWGRLLENLSQVQARLYDSSSDMLEDVRSGRLLLSYNVLGSYARSWLDKYPELGLILPQDYVLVMSRIAFVPARAPNPGMGHRFLDYLLSLRGQQVLAQQARLFSIHPDVRGELTYRSLQEAARNRGPLKLIRLGPALLTYQDRLKKQYFLGDWEQVMRHQ
ncbi:MAG: ABC transporter substrate-binding protein [Thiothrix sp.]|nr:ABC transporter substrate-binding protein [Thiothrix sp.]